jgi:hypothetical protein
MTSLDVSFYLLFLKIDRPGDGLMLTRKLTPWSRVLPEKLKRPQLLKKFPAFYGTRRFITAYTTARHLSLS